MNQQNLACLGLLGAAFVGLSIFPITGGAGVEAVEPVRPAPEKMSLQNDIKPFLSKYCVDCHGAEVQKAKFALHDITLDEADLQHWEMIAENIELELMPPPKKPQPTEEERFAVVDWIRDYLEQNDRGFNPEPTSPFGNRVRHEDLFSGEHTGPAFSYSRMWRISQRIYDSISKDFNATSGPAGRGNGPIAALVGVEGEAFKDYDLLRVDDAAARAMILNFRHLSNTIVRGIYRPGRFDPKTNEVGPGTYDSRRAALRGIRLLKNPEAGPEAYDEAVVESFKLLLSREPNEVEHKRYRGFLTRAIELSNNHTGCQQMVMAILMSPEFIFRMELGRGEELGDGRRMLGPQELSYAIAYALTDSPPDRDLKAAQAEGRLKTREDVEREVRRMLSAGGYRKNWSSDFSWGRSYDWTPAHNPRLLRFFQEFFGYTKGDLVFKDEKRNPQHHPLVLMRELDYLILDIIEKDENVLETLLTTDRYIVGYAPADNIEEMLRSGYENAYERPYGFQAGALREGLRPGTLPGHRYPVGSMGAYNISYHEWNYPLEQPFKVENRVGVLTHPAWLVAWSGNFDNDIIRRGKWIREHLLADALPELPIGVDAQLPNDPHKTLRDRMYVTRVDECWRCHKQMDPLGMAFEEYDDFGRYRDGTIVLGDEEAHISNVRKHGKQRGRALKELWKLTAQSPEARKHRVAWLEKNSTAIKPPEKGHERYDEIIEEQRRNRERIGKEIETLTAGPTHPEWEQKADEIRKMLAEMTPPKPEHYANVDAKGVLTGTRDPELDGPYDGAHDLMHRLAKSERVRQSFIRHVFRYFMGRNEMLSDSPTLMAMDQAYVESGGSFKEIIVTLMISDSFLTRRDKD